jgi:SOS-response transcriptional repressor LexA
MTSQLNISEQEYQTFDYIRSYLRSCGKSPTIAEIASEQKVSATTINTRLKRLEVAGWITRKRYQTRSIQIVKREDKPASKQATRRQNPRYDITIVKVFKNENTVTVTYNGLSKSWRPQNMSSQELIDMYKSLGYKYCPLPNNVALLTRKTARTVATSLQGVKAA